MRVATVTETKNRLSALIDQVRAGETVLIVDRGVPVARIESAAALTDDVNGRLARLQRTGAIRAAEGEPPLELLREEPPRPKGKASAVSALLAERREGR